MLKSVQLTLMMGPIIPVTVPRTVLDSLASVEVKVEDVGSSGFQLVFSIDKQSPLQILFLLSGGDRKSTRLNSSHSSPSRMPSSA